MSKVCEQCGCPNPEAANFCRQCGYPTAHTALRPVIRPSPVMQQWRRLKHKMTRREVRAILGEPARVESVASAPTGPERWSYQYEQAGPDPARLFGVVEFALPDGVVAAWVEPDWSLRNGDAVP